MSKRESISHYLIENSHEIHGNGDLTTTDKEELLNDTLKESLFTISGYSTKVLRSIKLEIEDLIIQKILALEDIEKEDCPEKAVHYFKDHCIDKIGNQVIVGQTGIAEGWRVPLYKSEFQSLLGLPFTEDHAVTDSLRIKKPKQECFNCLSTDHRVTDCPVKINNERIAMHRSEFNSQSMQSSDQATLFSARYTSDPDAKLYRGFTPGKLSDELRAALGCKKNQLPPFIYMMRKYGYPAAWLIEAKVDSSNKLSVHNGDKIDGSVEESVIPGEDLVVEYDQNRIFSFFGFNEAPAGFDDESETYGVRRYSEEMSREKFLSTLNLEKKKIIKRRSVYRSDSQTEASEEMETKKEVDELEQAKDVETPPASNEQQSENNLKKETSEVIDHGASFNEIPGTPIVNNARGITMVPTSEKFSENICEHRCFEMDSGTPTGSYKRIVDLTREFTKSQAEKPPQYDDEN